MATVPDTFGSPAAESQGNNLVRFIDRWIYVFMAVFFIVTVLAGFIPTSLQKLGEVEAGIRPPLPMILHAHAVAMGSWLLLLLAQTWLMATGKPGIHKQLGMASLIVAPLMVAVGFVLVPTMFGMNWAMLDAAAAVAPPAEIAIGRNFARSIVASQIAAGVMFGIFVAIGLRARKSDAGLHKRMMILATAVPLPAGIDRLAFLPTSYPDSALSPFLYGVAWITPMLLWDLWRNRTLHRAYRIWFALYVPVATLVIWLWWRPDWMAFSQRLMGF